MKVGAGHRCLVIYQKSMIMIMVIFWFAALGRALVFHVDP